MATIRSKTSSFTRNVPREALNKAPGLRNGFNGTTLISTGIADLDKILGGGFSLGTVVMVMEDSDSPHHLLLLRNFMSQGVVHNQPILYASPFKDPRAFLGTLPSPVSSKDQKYESGHQNELEQVNEKGLRIAWQYKKYFGEQQTGESHRDAGQYCNDFDLRKPLDRHLIGEQHVECISLQDSSILAAVQDKFETFLAQLSRTGGTGRIVIQSLCAPQCGFFDMDLDLLSFIMSVKSMVRSAKAVAMITLPLSLLSPSFSKRWQHLADTLISVRAIPDEDKEMAKLLTGYQDMIGLLHVHKVARINTQVPFIPEASTFSIKLHRRRTLALEPLNQAPIDASSGTSYGSSRGCTGSSKASFIDF